ncbi:MAG: MinD/ParA family protein [Firmicutes bacterium]|nr:MinD/ParA family protein [Bacillota bacterium]
MVNQAEKLTAFKKNAHSKNLAQKVRVITITSGKGGVGKSNITVNLALALAKMGNSVCIFDADFGLANVDILMGLVPKYNMHHVISGDKKLADILVEGPLGIHIVPGSSGLLDMANLNGPQRQQLLKQLLELERTTDIILIDTGAGISKLLLGLISAAHDVILITNPEPTAMTDAYGVAKIIGKYKLHNQVKLIVNQVKNMQEGEAVAERFSQVADNYLSLSVDYLGYISNDSLVARSVRDQQPFLIGYPKSKASVCVERIASQLVEPYGLEVHRDSGMSNFFSKIAKIFS